MEVGKLTVSLRNSSGKGAATKLRASGKVPGVCYGASPSGNEVDRESVSGAKDKLGFATVARASAAPGPVATGATK